MKNAEMVQKFKTRTLSFQPVRVLPIRAKDSGRIFDDFIRYDTKLFILSFAGLVYERKGLRNKNYSRTIINVFCHASNILISAKGGLTWRLKKGTVFWAKIRYFFNIYHNL